MVKINLTKKPDLRKFNPPNLRKPDSPNLRKLDFTKPKPPKRKFNIPGIPEINEPQEGLEPIIGDIYGTPPVDPRDCELYPDSPWCGGNPLSRKPISYSFSFVKDECNTGVQLDGVFGFIKMPPVQIVYRNPDCKISTKPELPTFQEFETPIQIPSFESGFFVYYSPYRLFYVDGGGARNTSFRAYCKNKISIKILEYNLDFDLFQPLGKIPNGQDYYGYLKYLVNIDIKANSAYGLDSIASDSDGVENCRSQGWNIPDDWNTNEQAMWSLKHEVTIERYYDYSVRSIFQEFSNQSPINLDDLRIRDVYVHYFSQEQLKSSNFSKNKSTITRTQYNRFYYEKKPDDITINSDYEERAMSFQSKGSDAYGVYYLYNTYSLEHRVIEWELLSSNPPPAPPIPPMSCCPNVRENDELLRLIAKRLGAYDYPVSVPKILTDRSKGTESIENLTRFHSWLGKNLDALCGKYPVEIEIKDNDLTKEGDQTKTIKIPNMAEGIGEMIGMLLQIQSETSATLNAAIRTLIETASTKQATIIAHDYAKANAEFLGYKGEQEIRKTPFMCTPGKERLDEVLDESEIDVKGWENIDEQDIKDLLAPLLEMAAMFRAQNFRNLGTKDTFGTLAKTLQNPQLISTLGDFIKKEKKKDENQDPKEEKKKNENDFDKFIEEAENGFIAKEGIRDNTNPYGRPYEERPLIREIGTTTGE